MQTHKAKKKYSNYFVFRNPLILPFLHFYDLRDLFVVVCNVKRRIHLVAYVILRGFFKNIILMSTG